MKKVYSGRMSMDEWISFFVEFIVPDDLSEDIVELFLRHLMDLKVLTLVDDKFWEWKTCNSQVHSENLIAVVQNNLESLCDLDSGFALPYFIGFKNLSEKTIDAKSKLLGKGSTKRHGEPSKNNKPASDLSNLQIVKKVGKQLQPFLQIEESIVSRLVGENVSKQDAKKLFHYMFGKMNSKAEPRVWEQLSRKRHR